MPNRLTKARKSPAKRSAARRLTDGSASAGARHSAFLPAAHNIDQDHAAKHTGCTAAPSTRLTADDQAADVTAHANRTPPRTAPNAGAEQGST